MFNRSHLCPSECLDLQAFGLALWQGRHFSPQCRGHLGDGSITTNRKEGPIQAWVHGFHVGRREAAAGVRMARKTPGAIGIGVRLEQLVQPIKADPSRCWEFARVPGREITHDELDKLLLQVVGRLLPELLGRPVSKTDSWLQLRHGLLVMGHLHGIGEGVREVGARVRV